jgi:nitronate monooxygenase
LKHVPTATFPREFESGERLPVGVGFQLWNGSFKAACEAVEEYQPCAAWLFAPGGAEEEAVDQVMKWSYELREASTGIDIWLQVGTLKESNWVVKGYLDPDVLVVQGAEAGGHGRANDGMGIMSLFPEVADLVRNPHISLITAGGIADGRGVAAALTLGADGVAMGTRFLASTESPRQQRLPG